MYDWVQVQAFAVGSSGRRRHALPRLGHRIVVDHRMVRLVRLSSGLAICRLRLLLSRLGLPALKHRRLHIRIYCEIIALVQETLVLLLPHAFILVRDLRVSVQGQHILLLRLEQALVARVELQVGLVLRLHLRLHGLLVELGVEGDLPVLPL